MEKYLIPIPPVDTDLQQSVKALSEAMAIQQRVIENHEQAIGLLLREVKALKEAKPKIWTT